MGRPVEMIVVVLVVGTWWLEGGRGRPRRPPPRLARHQPASTPPPLNPSQPLPPLPNPPGPLTCQVQRRDTPSRPMALAKNMAPGGAAAGGGAAVDATRASTLSAPDRARGAAGWALSSTDPPATRANGEVRRRRGGGGRGSPGAGTAATISTNRGSAR